MLRRRISSQLEEQKQECARVKEAALALRGDRAAYRAALATLAALANDESFVSEVALSSEVPSDDGTETRSLADVNASTQVLLEMLDAGIDERRRVAGEGPAGFAIVPT